MANVLDVRVMMALTNVGWSEIFAEKVVQAILSAGYENFCFRPITASLRGLPEWHRLWPRNGPSKGRLRRGFPSFSMVFHGVFHRFAWRLVSFRWYSYVASSTLRIQETVLFAAFLPLRFDAI